MQRVFPLLILGLILAITGVAYRGVIHNGFVWDDFHAVVKNASIKSLSAVGYWFSSPYATSNLGEGNYRPILMASYALDHAAWGDRPAGYHATNLFVHFGVILLVFALARQLWQDRASALGAAAVVALHPLNAEAVNYISARSSLLTALFILVAVWAYDTACRDEGVVRPRMWGRRMKLGIGLVMGALALGTKETAVVLPLLIIVWSRARHGEREAWATTLVRSLPWWGLVVFFAAARTVVLMGASTASPIAGGVWQAGLFAVKIHLSSFGHWLWPVGLAIDHAWSPVIGAPEGALLIVGLGGAVLATWGVFRRDRRMGWCLAWCWAALLPLIALPVVTRFTLYQDHRVYLGGVGLAWMAGRAAAMGARQLARSWSGRIVGATVATGLVVAAVLADAERTTVWANPGRLWQDVASKYPQSTFGPNSLGLLYLDAGELENAKRAFEDSIRLVPSFAESHQYLGVVYAKLGNISQSITEFEAALKINSHYAAARLNLGNAYEQTGRPERALDAYERGFPDGPWAIETLDRSARLLERQGRLNEALERRRRIVRIDPTRREARMALGALSLRLERWADAREAFEAVLAHQPDVYEARVNLGIALDELGQEAQALDAYGEAALLKPDDPQPYFRIAVMNAKRGRWSDAAMWYERALGRDPGHLFSHLHLAMVAERLGERRRAVEHYQAVVSMAPRDAAYDAPRTEAREALARLGGGGP